eukprot:m.39404 g.39404  ORF g.39404 m.39404 type:complete len:423 (+) comp7956_c0_seq1:188-1456(+)
MIQRGSGRARRALWRNALALSGALCQLLDSGRAARQSTLPNKFQDRVPPWKFSSGQGLIPLQYLDSDSAARHVQCQQTAFDRYRRRGAAAERFLILQSTNYKSKPMLCAMYMVNRAVWADAFGHGFVFRRLPPDVQGSGYAHTASAKPRLILAELKLRLSLNSAGKSELAWIVWMDTDTFVSPLDPPDFASLVQSVPSHKMLLVAQAHNLNTGVVLIRVHHDAVKVVTEWVRIMASGVIDCHAWDQAGLQWMYAHAINHSFSRSTPCRRPLCAGIRSGMTVPNCDMAYWAVVSGVYGTKHAIQCGVANDITGPLGVLMDRDESTLLHCWSCFTPRVCKALERQVPEWDTPEDACISVALKTLRNPETQGFRCERTGGGEHYKTVLRNVSAYQITHGSLSTLEFNFHFSECTGTKLHFDPEKS